MVRISLAAAAVVELAAQAADLDVDGPVVGVAFTAAGQVQQLVAGQHALRAFDEGAQQRELAARQVDHHRLRRAQLAADQVQAPAGELAGRAHAVIYGARLLAAAQHRADAGQQLARIARLGQIVVGAQLEPDDAVGPRPWPTA